MSGKQDLKNLFKRRPNEWIPCYEILPVAGYQYNARIKELREDKYEPMHIENKLEVEAGKRQSWFRYVVGLALRRESTGQMAFV